MNRTKRYLPETEISRQVVYKANPFPKLEDNNKQHLMGNNQEETDGQNNLRHETIEELRDINSLFDAGIERDITINPTNNNTPSQLGMPCDRRLVFAQTRGTEAQKHSVKLQKVYDYGKLIEEYVQTRLKKDGFAILENQKPFRDHSLNLSAKIDCMIKHDNLSKKQILCEIKSMSPFDFDKYNKQEDFLHSNKHYYKSYYTQIQAYLYLVSLDKQEFEEWGTLILFNKNTACLKGIMFRRDDTHIEEEIFKKCERINYYVKNKIIPHAEYNEVICSECPFNHICDVAQLNSSDAFLIDELELIEAIKERERLKESYKKYDELDEFIKESFKKYKKGTGKNHFLLGNYEVKVNTINSKKYIIPDEIKNKYATVTSYDKITIRSKSGSIPSLSDGDKAKAPTGEGLENDKNLVDRSKSGSIPSLADRGVGTRNCASSTEFNKSVIKKLPTSQLNNRVAELKIVEGKTKLRTTSYELPTKIGSAEEEPTDEEIVTIQKELEEKEKLMNEILCYYEKSITNIDLNKIKNELILKDNNELSSLLDAIS